MAEQISPQPDGDDDDDAPSSPRRRNRILSLLEYIFQALVVLKETYHCMYPNHPQTRYHRPNCHYCPGHLSDMLEQGERMTFIGMLLRTADKIRYFQEQSLQLEVQLGQSYFTRKVKKLKRDRPDIAHGVAVLNFLAAGLCRNDISTLQNLLHLVHALRESSEKCTHDCPPFHGELADFYKEKSVNCTLTLIAECLNQHCRVCDSNNKNRIEDCEKKLGKCLHPSNWHGCGDCESMLVDILVYTKMLYNTDNRMMASLRLTLNYHVVNGRQNLVACQEELKWLSKHLVKEGFTEVKHCESPLLGNTHLKISLDYEAIYISGWQDDKKDRLRVLLDGFLQRKDRRLFFIQCKYQVLGANRPPYCCEPQIQQHLNALFSEEHHRRPSPLAVLGKLDKSRLVQFIDVCMLLEQDPCHKCRKIIMPVILNQLGDHLIPPQLVTMLEYEKQSTPKQSTPKQSTSKQSTPKQSTSEQSTSEQSVPPFLERLTGSRDREPVVRLKSLEGVPRPFELRHSCMACGGCRYVRCHRHFKSLHNVPCLYPGHYSKPSIALTVESLRHHKLQIRSTIARTEPHGFMQFHGVTQLTRPRPYE